MTSTTMKVRSTRDPILRGRKREFEIVKSETHANAHDLRQ